MRRLRLLFIVCLLTGCAEQAKKSTVLIPVEERNVPVVNANDEITPDHKNTVRNNKQTEPVIVALIDEANSFAKQGNSAKAAATIERGLRIEPKNARLWHQLAAIRIQQQQWQQAIDLARKSNALAAYNPKLKSANWGLIAKAYDRLGNKQKADEARAKQRAQS